MESEKGCDQEAMLDVLYGEADEITERAVRAHQEACAACRDELAALRGVSRSLAAWTLPESFRPRADRLRRVWRPLLAAAAGLLLALGVSLGLAGSELRYQDGSLAFRLGRGEDLSRLLAQQEDRHRRQMEELRSSLVQPAVQPAPRDEEALLRAVRRLIDENQHRQTRALENRLADFRQQTEAQRRYDLAQVGASLSYLEGKTGLQMAKTTELMGHVIQASQKR
jgi:hypothetical protein